MKRRVSWLICMRRINILQSFYLGPSIGENVQFEDISISLSLTFYPLSSSKTCMNKSNSPSSSRRDLLGRGPQQNHKIPPENFTIFLHMDTFTCKVELFYATPSRFVAIGRIGQSFITLSQLVKFPHETSWGEKLIQRQAELKWLREIEGGERLWGESSG